LEEQIPIGYFLGGNDMEKLKIDCFAGGGGASVGIEMALGRAVDHAINTLSASDQDVC